MSRGYGRAQLQRKPLEWVVWYPRGGGSRRPDRGRGSGARVGGPRVERQENCSNTDRPEPHRPRVPTEIRLGRLEFRPHRITSGRTVLAPVPESGLSGQREVLLPHSDLGRAMVCPRAATQPRPSAGAL